MTEPLTHTAGDTLAWRRDDLTSYTTSSTEPAEVTHAG